MNNQMMSLSIEDKDQSTKRALDWYQVVKIIKEHYFFLLSIISIITISVMVVTFYSLPTYETTSQIIIDPNSDTLIKKDYQESIDTNVYTLLYQTKYRLLQSREIFEHLIHNKEMIKDHFFQQWVDEIIKKNKQTKWKDKKSIKAEEERIDSILIEKLRQKIKIYSVPNTQLIEITAQSENPVLAQKMANIFAIESCNYDDKWRQSMYKEVLDKIQKKIESSRIEIDKLTELKKIFNEKNKKKEVFLNQDAYDKIVLSNINSLQLLQFERNKIKSEHAKELRSEEFKVKGDDYLISIDKKIANSKAELASLSQVYKDNYPSIISLKKMISELSDISRKFRHEKNREIEMTIESKDDLEKKLNQKIEQMITNYNDALLLRNSQSFIEKKLEVKFKSYQQLLNLFEIVRINQETKFQQMRFLNRASYPISTVSPEVIKNTILSFIISTFFSFTLVLARKI